MAVKPKESGKTKKKNIGNSTGAKGKYNEDFPLLVEGWARRGATDQKMAEALGISHDTFYKYIKRHTEFAEALKKGRAPVDIDVENALLKNALGFEYEEVHTEITKNGDKQNVKKKIVKRYQTPNLGAQIFWLINRLPELWKQRKQDDARDNMEEIKEQIAAFMEAL